MKDVLISTQPKWVAKICNEIYKRADGTPVYEKEIELRKTRPKQEVPFKCYIYETKGKKVECGFHFEETGRTLRDKYVFGCKEAKIVKHYCNEGSGKVIGEFICDRIEELQEWELSPSKKFYEVEKSRLDLFLKESCLSYDEICEYRKNLPYFKPLYGWHISNLKIYDKPKELSEFGNTKGEPITRAFQSWGYVNAEID